MRPICARQLIVVWPLAPTASQFILGAINAASVRRALAAWKRGYSLVLLNEAAALTSSGAALREPQSRAIVFTAFDQCLDLLVQTFAEAGVPAVRCG